MRRTSQRIGVSLAETCQAIPPRSARYRVTRTHREHLHGFALRASRLHPHPCAARSGRSTGGSLVESKRRGLPKVKCSVFTKVLDHVPWPGRPAITTLEFGNAQAFDRQPRRKLPPNMAERAPQQIVGVRGMSARVTLGERTCLGSTPLTSKAPHPLSTKLRCRAHSFWVRGLS